MATRAKRKTSDSSASASRYRVVVLELSDVVPRLRPQRPNVYVGVTTRSSQQLADGLNEGRHRPSWARNNVVATRDELVRPDLVTHEQAKQLRAETIRDLRTVGFTVNRIERVYCTYVVNLHNPNLKDPGKGYVYVGETSLTPEERLAVHLEGKRSEKGQKLSSAKVLKYGKDLNYGLMSDEIYLTRAEAKVAERLLAEKLRDEGYKVEGGH